MSKTASHLAKHTQRKQRGNGNKNWVEAAQMSNAHTHTHRRHILHNRQAKLRKTESSILNIHLHSNGGQLRQRGLLKGALNPERVKDPSSE
jgi:hypothetical protein